MTVATRITVPLLSDENIRDAARELEWLARDLRRIHTANGLAGRKVLLAQHRVRMAHKSLMVAAVGENSRQNFHKAT